MSETEIFRMHSLDKAALRRVSKTILFPSKAYARAPEYLFKMRERFSGEGKIKQVPVSQAVEVMPEIISGENDPVAVVDSLVPEMFMGREVVRCRHCLLNQFMTQNGVCRKCRYELIVKPDPVPDIQPSAPPVKLPANSGGIDMAFAVKLLRLLNGYSQNELCSRMEVPRSFISKIENLKCVPCLATIEKLSVALNVTPFIMVTIAEVSCAA